MRGDVERQTMILSTGTPDQLIPQDHPIRLIKPMVDRALSELSPTFSRMYAKVGRPSIPPEHLLKGCLLMAQDRIRNMKSGTLELAGIVTKGTWREGDSSYIRVSRTNFEEYGRFRADEEVVVRVYKRAWQQYISRSGSLSQHDIVRIRHGTSSTAERLSSIERLDEETQ